MDAMTDDDWSLPYRLGFVLLFPVLLRSGESRPGQAAYPSRLRMPDDAKGMVWLFDILRSSPPRTTSRASFYRTSSY